MARCCPPEAPGHATAAGAFVAAVRAPMDSAEAAAVPGQHRSDAAAACFAASRSARRANILPPATSSLNLLI